MSILETNRLRLRKVSLEDANFILRLLNEPSFLQNIGDKGVRSLEDARAYISTGPIASYARFGFGLWMLETKDQEIPIGLCGLLKRDALEDVDIGYALLPEFWSKGYALESASAVVDYGRDKLRLKRLVAITSPDNESSIRLLEKIGFRFEKMVRLSENAPEIKLFGRDLDRFAVERRKPIETDLAALGKDPNENRKAGRRVS